MRAVRGRLSAPTSPLASFERILGSLPWPGTTPVKITADAVFSEDNGHEPSRISPSVLCFIHPATATVSRWRSSGMARVLFSSESMPKRNALSSLVVGCIVWAGAWRKRRHDVSSLVEAGTRYLFGDPQLPADSVHGSASNEEGASRSSGAMTEALCDRAPSPASRRCKEGLC